MNVRFRNELYDCGKPALLLAELLGFALPFELICGRFSPTPVMD